MAVVTGTKDKYLRFRVDNQRLLLPLDCIQIIVRITAVETIPSISPAFWGMLNYHGSALPTFSLAKLLDADAEPHYDLSNQILLCETTGNRLGLIISAAEIVLEISTDRIQKPDLTECLPYLEGLYNEVDNPAWVINLQKLMAFNALNLKDVRQHE